MEFRGQQHRRWVEKEAAGVVAAIIGYNYPTQLALAKLSPALAAGCTVVLKAAPDTPLITLALGELIAEHTDIPPGVVNVLSSSDVAVGEALTTSPDVDVVTFTGSTATGRRIMAAASATIKRVFLELGGKSALVVLDDADLAGPLAVAAFATCSHAGQGCAIPTRMLVPRAQHDAIVEQVAAVLGRVTYGDPADQANYMGPLISERQRDKVDGLVQRAVAAGATLVTGGEKVDPGYFYTPTLLTNVDPDSEIAQEEVFGPVLVIIPHDGDDDAVRIANNSIYGLSGAVYGSDERALGGRAADQDRHRRRQRRRLVRPRRAVRRVQAVGRRPGDGPGRARGVPRVQVAGDPGRRLLAARPSSWQTTTTRLFARPPGSSAGVARMASMCSAASGSPSLRWAICGSRPHGPRRHGPACTTPCGSGRRRRRMWGAFVTGCPRITTPWPARGGVRATG